MKGSEQLREYLNGSHTQEMMLQVVAEAVVQVLEYIERKDTELERLRKLSEPIVDARNSDD